MAFVRATVALATFAGTITAPILLLALRSAADVAVFSPVSRFFALVWELLLFLRNFRFYSLATLMVYPFLLRLSILRFSLSHTIAVLAGAPISGGPCFCVWGFFLSVPAELCLLPLLLLGVGWALTEPLLV